ncbi:MAG: TIGR02710 family CRISPR-associated protein [Candidatus Zixiibacteriota bacterium]|nr:MAG: TIGR02710 family CRISPR-associated protein [candidate division Zixibacteria bacterium]
MKSKKTLVINVGGSPEPVIESLNTHKPDVIYFIPSTESQNKIDEIISRAYPDGFTAQRYKFVIDDHNNLVSCYKQCFNVFEDIKKAGISGKDIVIDLTGGTKQMSAALALAATEQGLKVSYVGGEERTKDGLGTVVSGTEKIYYSSHPFDILAKTEKERFCHYFNTYRFTPAIDVCNYVIDKSSQRMSSIFKCLKKIAEGYRNWDLFKFENSLKSINSGINCLNRLSELYQEDVSRLNDFLKPIKENANQLEGVLNASPKERISMETVEELVANALRRAEEGKYDDAVARLYRALEMIAQSQFIKIYNQSTSKFPYDKLCDELKERYSGKIEKENTVDLGCYSAYKQLSIEDNKYGKLFMQNEIKIKSLLEQRNKSIMAHGITPLSKKKFENLYDEFVGIFGIDGKKIKFAKLDPSALIPVGIDWGN